MALVGHNTQMAVLYGYVTIRITKAAIWRILLPVYADVSHAASARRPLAEIDLRHVPRRTGVRGRAPQARVSVAGWTRI
jgi:hypothetical protein